MSQTPLDEAARLLARRVGLRLDPAVRGRLARAVRDEAERLGTDSSAYVAHLHGDAAALQDLLNRVTVQETSFFRDPGQFVALANEVLPSLGKDGAPVHVWSAGCANGQEAYSLAMVLAESGLPQWQVVATDISTKALARTAEARYGTHELAGLSPERRDRYLVPVAGASDAWEVAPSLRKKVLAFRHNLAADPPPLPAGRCHVVFCRNVLIYFGHDDVVAFLNSLAAWLPPGAHLFLGYSESLWLVSERFHLVRLGDAFVYRNGPAPGAAATRQASAKGAARPAGATPQSPTAEVSPPPRPASAAARPASAAARAANAAGAARAPSPVPRLEPNEAGLLAEGEAAMGAGDYAGAVIAFRKAAFLDPDQPVAHLSLGLALEATGDRAAAQRAFTAARAAFDRGDTAAIETTLEGYRLDEFTRLLDLKTGTV